MISIGAIGSASDAAGYYAKDNYYTQGEATQASFWTGEGAAMLGLDGPVEPVSFEAILAGRLPDGTVVGAARAEHRPGLDLTFSAPKSLSILALVGGDRRLIDAHRESVVSTLGWVERNLIEVRTWDGKRQTPVRTGNLVAALFAHDLGRRGDPQTHIHAVIANLTRDPKGQWRALHNDALYVRQHVIAAVHNADLRARVEALGYQTAPAKNPIDSQFEIAGVSRETVLAFSKATAAIDAALAGRGRGSARERELAALSTRPTKTADIARDEQRALWAETAAGIGFDARALVEAALGRTARRETLWTRVVVGVRGIGARGGALAAAAGLATRDGDPLVPERAGKLSPKEYVAAQAVASAVRDLSEREAAFDRYDLLRAALERGGPVTAPDIEARIASLTARGLLKGGREGRLLTTEGAIRIERAVLAEKAIGDAKVAPVVASEVDARVRTQAAARELGLRRLTPRQEAAAALLLTSTDRIVAVQGVAGAGKSAVLAPVTAVARGEGRAVIGLAIANTVARDLAAKTGADVMTVAGFLGKHRGVLDGTASPARVSAAKAELRGAVLMVDEAAMLGSQQTLDLIRLANQLEVGRLALVGDTRQLGAVEAGKPFAMIQHAGAATAELPDNLRAKSDTMKAVVSALNTGDTARAFDVLRPVTVAVQPGDAPGKAAELWAALPRQEREATMILASGRRVRAEANAHAQAHLKIKGEIGGEAVRLTVLDRVNTTREGARDTRAYQEGRVVEFRTNLPAQGFARGDRGVVADVENDRVRLVMSTGGERAFVPERLPRNLKHDAVSIYARKALDLHAGDRIRWTDTDKTRGLVNADLARVERVGEGGITVTARDGAKHSIKPGDPVLERLDLAYALNAHMAQGATATHGIVAMNARETKLLTERTFLVALTRIEDRVTLVIDNAPRIERSVTTNAGEKTSALDVVGASPVERGVVARFSACAPKQPIPATNTPTRITAEPSKAKPAPRGQTKLPVPQKMLEIDI